jgi:hypothetical protein
MGSGRRLGQRVTAWRWVDSSSVSLSSLTMSSRRTVPTSRPSSATAICGTSVSLMIRNALAASSVGESGGVFTAISPASVRARCGPSRVESFVIGGGGAADAQACDEAARLPLRPAP